MKLSHLLCAMLACVPLTFEARATAGDRGSTSRDAAVAASSRRGSGNADRLHSLLNAQARGHPARQPGRSVRSARAISAPPPAARLASIPRISAIGGPHPQAFARVGGPAVSRTTHIATIDGAQLHH